MTADRPALLMLGTSAPACEGDACAVPGARLGEQPVDED